MDRLLLVSATIALLALLAPTNAENDERREISERALDLLNRLMTRGDDDDCGRKGQACDAVITQCCGTLQCYWPAGYSMRTKGHCVTCVKAGNKCQRDSQCCPHYQCNKGNVGWTDGTCEKYRRDGDCYRDGQCVNDCVKKWYNQFKGRCT